MRWEFVGDGPFPHLDDTRSIAPTCGCNGTIFWKVDCWESVSERFTRFTSDCISRRPRGLAVEVVHQWGTNSRSAVSIPSRVPVAAPVCYEKAWK
jgi:hypothetical protein